MLLEGDVVLHEGLKVCPLLDHVGHGVLPVLEVVPRVALQLVPKGPEEAVPGGGGRKTGRLRRPTRLERPWP